MIGQIKHRWNAKTPKVIKKLQKMLAAFHTSATAGLTAVYMQGGVPKWIPISVFFTGIAAHVLLELFTEED
jgi:hypothetical protein